MLLLFTLPSLGQPSPPSHYGGVTLQGPLARTEVWKPQTWPLACLSARRLKKGGERERRRKGENSFVPGCIFLCLWFPSTLNVNKQRHERGKHGQSGGGKKTGGGRGGGRKQSASKNILAGCVRYKSPAHLLVSLPDKNTHSQATQIWLSHTSSQRSLCESCDKLLTHFNINLLDNSCKQSCCFSED